MCMLLLILQFFLLLVFSNDLHHVAEVCCCILQSPNCTEKNYYANLSFGNHSQRFGEIAFCAITADEQVKGYGTRLMNHLKQHARDTDGLTHFLTYADNNAVGYFVKQVWLSDLLLVYKYFFQFLVCACY